MGGGQTPQRRVGEGLSHANSSSRNGQVEVSSTVAPRAHTHAHSHRARLPPASTCGRLLACCAPWTSTRGPSPTLRWGVCPPPWSCCVFPSLRTLPWQVPLVMIRVVSQSPTSFPAKPYRAATVLPTLLAQ